MAIRHPDQSIAIPTLVHTQPMQWHTMKCELVTPLYGGGVQSSVVDLQMPIRVSSIRGQLRFWWRLLAKHKWNSNDTSSMQKAEFALWGGPGDDTGRASQVFFKVSDVPKESTLKNCLKSFKDLKLNYILFPAKNETVQELKPHQLLDIKGKQWTLSFAFSAQLASDENRVNQVIETLQWWANFGGLGLRTRKGLGAVHVSACDDYPKITHILSAKDVQWAGCQLVLRAASADAFGALSIADKKLSSFRQGIDTGRNPGQQPDRPGRSRWPEPDAMRRIVGRDYVPKHQPVHLAGNIFPRALFGLPIVLYFSKEQVLNASIVPAEGERLASPLILRPQFVGVKNDVKQWSPCALLLPYEHIKRMQVKVEIKSESIKHKQAKEGNLEYPIWNQEGAQKIKPITDFDAADPLQAFLKYFCDKG